MEGTHTLANSLSTIPQKDLEILSNVQIREMNFAACECLRDLLKPQQQHPRKGPHS